MNTGAAAAAVPCHFNSLDAERRNRRRQSETRAICGTMANTDARRAMACAGCDMQAICVPRSALNCRRPEYVGESAAPCRYARGPLELRRGRASYSSVACHAGQQTKPHKRRGRRLGDLTAGVTIMIRSLFRFIGLFFWRWAFIFLVYDGTKSIADQRLYMNKVEEIWSILHESSLAQVQADTARTPPGSGIRSPVTILNSPDRAGARPSSGHLHPVGRKRNPLIGYAR